MARQKAPARRRPANSLDIEALPDELLAQVFRAAGLHASLKSLAGPGGSIRLHRVWQSAVTTVRIERKELNEGDAATIAKYAKLEQLVLRGLKHPSVPRVLNLAAPSLAGLKRLSIVECPDAFGALHVLGGCTGVQRSLEELELADKEHRLSDAQLSGLQGLARLSSLSFTCQELIGSFSGAAGVLQGSSLRRLSLETCSTPAAFQLATLPGCMVQLTQLSLGTAGRPGGGPAGGEFRTQQQGLAASLLYLTNLQRLSTSYALMDPAGQRQSLGRLQQLTHLKLSGDSWKTPLVALSQLSGLVELDAAGTIVQDPFPHPSLQRLAAASFELHPAAAIGLRPPAQQRQQAGCPLQELALTGCAGEEAAEDAALQHLPQLLPELRKLRVWLEPGREERFMHLAALLHRQAGTLQELRLRLEAAFQEVMPHELPHCRVLEIDVLGRHALHVLAMCRMPALEQLTLQWSEDDDAYDIRPHAELDFGWLRRLPALRRLKLGLAGMSREQLRGSVSALLQGMDVEWLPCRGEYSD